MNVAQLQTVNKTETSNNILNFLSKKDNISNKTNLRSFRVFLIRKGYKISNPDFIKFFKDLEDAGVGALSDYDGIHPTLFTWYYSLKDVSNQVLNPNKMIEFHLIDYSKNSSTTEDEKEPINEVKKKPPMKTPLKIVSTPLKKSKGRPKGSRNKPKTIDIASIPKMRHQTAPKANKEIIMVFLNNQQDIISMNLDEAERFCLQYQAVKAKLNI